MVEEIEREYDAIVLCIGASLANDIHIPGRNLKGVHLALDFLQYCIDNSDSMEGGGADIRDKSIVIIGGGASAMDCLLTAIRYGAKSVKTLSITAEPPIKRPPNNHWPNKPDTKPTMPVHKSAEYVYGTDTRLFNTETLALESNGDDQVHAVQTIQVEWVDVNGHLTPKRISGTENTLPADFVIIAIGFRGPEKLLIDECRLEYTNKHTIKTTNHNTTEEFIFAAGDCTIGESLVVTAMADGRKAAVNVDNFLKKGSLVTPFGGSSPINIDCSTVED